MMLDLFSCRLDARVPFEVVVLVYIVLTRGSRNRHQIAFQYMRFEEIIARYVRGECLAKGRIDAVLRRN